MGVSLGEAREGSRRVSNVVLELGKEEARKEGRGDSRPYLAYLLLLLASLLHTASSSLSPLLPATDPWLLLLLHSLLQLLLSLPVPGRRVRPRDCDELPEEFRRAGIGVCFRGNVVGMACGEELWNVRSVRNV